MADADLMVLRRYLKIRRNRNGHFSEDIFFDPAWDILVDLYAAELDGRQISISSACLAASVPRTTALRWIERLEELRLIERRADQLDRRRSNLSLTPKARHRLSKCMDELFAFARSA
ncbi:MAG: hypothetical protein R3E02_03590 [Blastomonas sp.]